MNAETGKRACVNMLLSGTASGVIGAAYLAEQAGIAHVLTLDIGGTSADLALIIDGKPQFGTGETDRRLPALRAQRLRHIDRQRRRLDRLGRRLRRAQGRAGKRRLDAGPGLLWPRRHARHNHRRDGQLRLPRPYADRL
jgi:hypothetical protein